MRKKVDPSVASRLRSALHERLDRILHEPLPKLWVDLIHELNERERMAGQARQSKDLQGRDRQ
jgi:hypothetical protein